MNSFSRGARNAFRNGVRTVSVVLILALAIGLALAMLVARAAVQTRIDSVKASIGNTITITPAGMRAFGGGGLVVSGTASYRTGSDGLPVQTSPQLPQGNTLTTDDLAKVKKVAHITAVNATLSARAETGTDTNLVSPTPQFMRQNSGTNATDNNDYKMPLGIMGVIDPNQLSSTLGDFSLSSGSMINGDSTANEAIIGDQLATLNNLKVGDTFTLFNTTIKVKGIINSAATNSSVNPNNSASPTVDTRLEMARNLSLGSVVIMPLEAMQKLSGNAGTINSITATVDNVANTDAAVAAITSVLGTDSNGNNIADVTSDKSQVQTTLDSLNSIKTTSTISVIACGIAAAVIIFLAMLMIVRERRGEIGVLKAIGAKGKTIITQFVAESLVLTVLAAIIGLGIGILAATPLTNTLVSSAQNSAQNSASSQTNSQNNGRPNFANFMRGGARQIGTVTANIDWTIVLWALGSAIIIAAVGATAASLVAMKVRPAEAVRAE